MAFCAACGFKLPDAAKYCPNCGAPSQGATDAKPSDTAVPAPPSPPYRDAQPIGTIRDPNAGCGRTAGIGCAVVLALVVLIAIIEAIMSGVSQSTLSNSAHRASRTPARTAHRRPTPAPTPQILLDVQGSGIKTTQRFQAPDEWAIVWSYDCSGTYGGNGNFAIMVEGDHMDVAANQLGVSGHDVSYEHSGGSVYLEMNSECAWHVRVLAQ